MSSEDKFIAETTTTEAKPPRNNHTGEVVAGKTVTGFAGRDHIGKPLWSWRCNRCGHEGTPCRWENLAALDRAGIQACNECRTQSLAEIPIGTERGRLVVIGPCRKGGRTSAGQSKREIQCRCLDCGAEGWWNKTNFRRGIANCTCRQHCQGGLSNTQVGILWSHARARARKRGLPFTITHADVVIPDVCPALGIPIVVGEGTLHDNSPSLDRIVPELGYVPGNVWVISHRANRIKNDATPDELMAIAKALQIRVQGINALPASEIPRGWGQPLSDD